MTKTEPTRTEWALLLILVALVGLLLAGCDNYVRVTAPDTTINITAPSTRPRPAVPANPQPPTTNPDATEPGSTDLMDPPSDVDVPFNEDPPDVVTPDPGTPNPEPDTCERPGRGGGTGAPGNGKGRGAENGKACPCTE